MTADDDDASFEPRLHLVERRHARRQLGRRGGNELVEPIERARKLIDGLERARQVVQIFGRFGLVVETLI